MAGFSYIDETNWKYTNLGTADLLCISGTTLADLPESQSKTGTAFYQTTRAKCFDLPATKEIWLRFDVYTTLSYRWRAYNDSSAGSCGVCSQTSGNLDFWANSNNPYSVFSGVKNQLQSVLLHMTSDSSAGIVEAWIDGEFIYRYTGNVNNGADFADIYLQSDGSGTYFSNVLISNVQNPKISRQVNIKPAIYVTALIDLPTAEIDINPEIYAVVATKPPTAEVCFYPEVYGTVSIAAPTAEIDIQSEIWAVIQPLAHLESATADTLLRAGLLQTAVGDTLRKVTFTPALERATGDTKLVLGQTQDISADTLRKLQCTEIATADTCRALREFATADMLRIICRQEETVADILIRRPRELRYTLETPARRKLLVAAPAQSLANSFKDYDVTSFSVTLNERTLSDNFSFETAQPFEIGDAVKGTLLDYPFSFLVEKTSQQGLIQTVNGMYDKDKQLYTHVWEEGESSAIDSTAVKASEYIQHIASYFGLTPNVKIQDFTPTNATKNTNITYSDLISTLFSWTSQLPQRQINVFIRGDRLYIIQRGMEDSAVDISGWRHSVPVIDKELVRTMWKNANDDGSGNSEDENPTMPFSGTIFYNDLYSSNEITYVDGLMRSEKYSTQNNKVASVVETRYEYDRLTYSSKDEPAYYLASKTSKSTTIEDEDIEVISAGYPEGKNLVKTIVESSATYIYKYSNDGVYLFKEYETEQKSTYWLRNLSWELDETEATDRQVTHVPAGNGWYATSIYVNGVHQGSSLSQGKPSNEVSLYTVEKSHFRVIHVETTKPPSSPIDTTSFPIEETEILAELVESLKWLNRKTKETVSVDIIDKISNGVPTINHIVDFTERVILDGKEYFLVSNQVQFTPRKLIQRLQLVRWY